jgi:hypothetical protein
MKLPNIEYKGDISHFIQEKDNPYECISYFKDLDYFEDEVLYNKFVKACEATVRHDADYKGFINWVKGKLGINFCEVSSSIYDTDATIEMHHGPIFTLYDVCAVIINWFLKRGKKINTFRIADKVLQEHYDLHVQVIMLTVTNHEAVHNRDIFNNFNQGIGNLNEFLKLYGDCLENDQKYKIWSYLNLCKSNPSFDRGILDVDDIEKMIKFDE